MIFISEMGKTLKEKELSYAWDGTKDRDTLIFRRMLYDNPKDVLKDYGEELLKKVFVGKYRQFDKRSRNFWKLILKVKDDEVEQNTKGSFESSNRLWNY